MKKKAPIVRIASGTIRTIRAVKKIVDMPKRSKNKPPKKYYF